MKVGEERLDYTSMQNKNQWKYTVRATAGTDRRSTRGHPKCSPVGRHPSSVPQVLYQDREAAKPHAIPCQGMEVMSLRPVRRNSLAGCKDEPGQVIPVTGVTVPVQSVLIFLM